MSDKMTAAQLAVAFDFQKSLMPMVAEQLLTSDGANLLVDKFTELIVSYTDELAENIHRLARDWEASMGDDDQTLYSLGIRHAADTILGNDPDRYFTEGTGVTPEDLS